MQTYSTFSSKTIFCSKYEELLQLCQHALDSWAKRREEASELGLHGKELGDELIRLQADFAKSYAVLRKHKQQCSLCQFAANVENLDSNHVIVSHNSQSA